jgi:hypothetical protein
MESNFTHDNQHNHPDSSPLSDTQLTPPAASVTLPPIKIKAPKPKAKSAPPPLLSLQITNPITYIKAWWKKLIGNDGIKLTIQIKPLTAIALALVFGGAGYGFGRLNLPQPMIQYLPYPSPAAVKQVEPEWKETAFTGKLQTAQGKYFLTTTSAEAITLEVPHTINLKPLVGKRILVVGSYNKSRQSHESLWYS